MTRSRLPFDVRITHPKKPEQKRVAEAELVFNELAGPLNGLVLVGFTIWENHGEVNVTMPSRSYTSRRDQTTRHFMLLHPLPVSAMEKLEPLENLILDAFDAWENSLPVREGRSMPPQLPPNPSETV